MMRVWIIAGVVWREMLRRKDVYVLLILLVAFLITLLALNIFGLAGLVTYVKEIGLLLAWLFSWILGVTISARQLPQEEQRGTIFPLLAKPVSRGELLVGKWLGSWTMAAVATAVFYAVLILVVRLRGGACDPVVLAQTLTLHCVLLGIIAAAGILFSTRLNADAAITLTFVVTLAAYLVLPRVPTLILHSQGFSQTALLILYYLLPHMELFDLRQRLVYGWPPVSAGTLLLVLIYGALITAGLLVLGWLAYRRKRFTRGAIL